MPYTKPITRPSGAVRLRSGAFAPALPPRISSQRDKIALTSAREAVASAVPRAAVWPQFMEMLIGIVAGGFPELIYFWWTVEAGTTVDEFRFTVSGIGAILVCGAAGLICRISWPRAGPVSVYRLFNTLVWGCAGSFVGFLLGWWILGVNTPGSHVLVPFCQGAMVLFAMAYARCGGITTEY